MAPPATDPTLSLEQKLTELAASLPADELAIFKDVLTRAAAVEDDVAGFAFNQMPNGVTGDPCEGGEIYHANTFNMLGNVLGKIKPPH
jgi:hypothetical protein